MLAVGAVGSCLDFFFSRRSFFFFFSPSLGDDPIQTVMLSQRAVQPKTTNHLKSQLLHLILSQNASNAVEPQMYLTQN